ncbi:phosphatidylglycerol:prolipoprotein diacylglycerol transferase [Pullulanibacillus pueri]|uniref:Phosphatidylglycerol--prolipoprotein diacylglyceryl transferase n=1 Tax=Pullulanibacillus pueri TaxID=1437324 RepID=A0A8J2ZU65_9BACL|nr:prolipoprotein diacylglyceryl transferase [Pullulanibacillus pueri]MBM7681068.1 phosphatidylglycerol:prolipoprotein diacylglycerol transferase [Pullulanibacillus pueri]GGH76921.1 prolipoprotein diacylglyceryl transferase [Pullulanibacillus pueri]
MHHSLNPIALTFGPLEIHWYGVIIISGLLLGYFIAYNELKRQRINPELLTQFVYFALPAAIIGARIYYVAFEWKDYKHNLSETIAIWHGGIAIHGAILGALLITLYFVRKKNLSFWQWTDIIAPSLILGQGIGRWGNFMNQEAHGGPVSLAFLEHLHLPSFIIQQMYIDGTYYAPTFLYESVWDIAGFILLFTLRRSVLKLKKGDIFLSYLVWYSIGRYYVEGLRTDSLMLTSSLRMAQVVSIVLIVVALFFFVYNHFLSRQNRSHQVKNM